MEGVPGGWSVADQNDDAFQEILTWATPEMDLLIEGERAVKPFKIIQATQQVLLFFLS